MASNYFILFADAVSVRVNQTVAIAVVASLCVATASVFVRGIRVIITC